MTSDLTRFLQLINNTFSKWSIILFSLSHSASSCLVGSNGYLILLMNSFVLYVKPIICLLLGSGIRKQMKMTFIRIHLTRKWATEVTCENFWDLHSFSLEIKVVSSVTFKSLRMLHFVWVFYKHYAWSLVLHRNYEILCAYIFKYMNIHAQMCAYSYTCTCCVKMHVIIMHAYLL